MLKTKPFIAPSLLVSQTEERIDKVFVPERNVLKVVIEKRHCENTFFLSCQDCALARAIREVMPDSNPRVGGFTVNLTIGETRSWFEIDSRWGPSAFDNLLSGKLQSFTLEINLNQ